MTTIRAARAGDVAAVQQLVQDAYAKYRSRIDVTPAPLSADYAALVAAGAVYVAELDGAVAGVLVLEAHPDHLLIENVAVTPNAQGRGVGAALLELAEQQAAAHGLTELRLYTHERMTENLAYYPRRGYVETHRTDDGTFHRVHFAKRLSGEPTRSG